MKILYLTFFEDVSHNGIYESQVKGLLYGLAAKYEQGINLSHIAILPAVVVGKGSVSFVHGKERKELYTVRREYEQRGIRTTFLFAPIVILKRWKSHPGLILSLFVMLGCVPALLYKMMRERYDIVHCRGYAATVCAFAIKVFFRRLKVVFDPRGFYPEEGVVQARWSENSLSFRIWKKLEEWLLRKSDKVIALSEAFTDRISRIAPTADSSLIYAGVEVPRFRQARQSRESRRRELEVASSEVFVYNGSLGAWHDPALLARVFRFIRQGSANSKMLVITGHNKAKLQEIFRSAGLAPSDYVIVAGEHDEVPGYLAAGDMGIVPLKETDESGAINVVADTMIGLKVAEYLASGLPIVVNKNVRGIHALMARHKIGIFFDAGSLDGLLPNIRHIQDHYTEYQQDCALVASRYLSLTQTTESYYKVYQEILRDPRRSFSLKKETAARRERLCPPRF